MLHPTLAGGLGGARMTQWGAGGGGGKCFSPHLKYSNIVYLKLIVMLLTASMYSKTILPIQDTGVTIPPTGVTMVFLF